MRYLLRVSERERDITREVEKEREKDRKREIVGYRDKETFLSFEAEIFPNRDKYTNL